MGIIINDLINLQVGIGITGAYASFGKQTIRCKKQGEIYSIYGTADIWIDNNGRNSDNKILEHVDCNIDIPIQSLDNNLYGLLYRKLKSFYSSTIDVFDV